MCFVLYMLHKSISHRNKNTTLNKKKKRQLFETLPFHLYFIQFFPC